MSDFDLTAGLNPAQLAAVTAPTGPLLVLAGPGSGKTRVLTRRIAYLVRELHLPPWQIMAVTFTNKAAREMRERVEQMLGENLRGILLGTFHASCARILRRETAALAALGYSPDFVVFDGDDQQTVVKQALKELNLDDKKFRPNVMLGHVSSAKDKLITPELYESSDYVSTVVKRVYDLYQRTLVANNAMDFDDLLLNVVRAFDVVPGLLEKYQAQYRHVLVDEFQDTNSVQYALLTRLAHKSRSIFAVGDSDQSIYKWRGADYRNLQRFMDDFPEAQQILLEQNYRSTQRILDTAMAVIKRNHDRVPKQLFTTRQGGPKVVIREAYNESEEAEQIINTIALGVSEGREPGDYAVMYRTNAQSRAIEDAFVRAGLPYTIVGGTRFYARREVKDIVAYLRLVHNPRDEVSFRRVVNTPTRGIGNKTLETLFAVAARHDLQGGEATIALATDPTFRHTLSGRALTALTQFGRRLADWIAVRDVATVGELVGRILDDTDYRSYIDDGTDEGTDRWSNVLELKGVADQAREQPLAEFLEGVALVSDIDEAEDGKNRPTLLTLHASKGLEYPIVFITGVEERVLPHSRSLEDAEEMAEERRLFYVGITRARDKLYISHAFRRTLYGMSDVATPSRFLADIPGDLVDGGNRLTARQAEAKQRMSSWHWDTDDDDSDSAPIRPVRDSYGEYGRRSSVNRSRPQSTSPAAPPPKVLPRPRHLDEASADAEPAERAAQPQYKTGQKVRHAKFGDGIVIQSKITGADEEVTVAFAGEGIKRLAASFARLEILS